MTIAATVIYIHGINNKPPADVLKCQWDSALFGSKMGERTRMAYWVNTDLHGLPLNETCAAGDRILDAGDTQPQGVSIRDIETGDMRALGQTGRTDVGDDVENALSEAMELGGDTEFIQRMGDRMLDVASRQEDSLIEVNDQFGVLDYGARVLPLPKWLRLRITRALVGKYLRDVSHFFYNPEQRGKMERSLRERLDAGGGPFVIVAHSQGTMIAYKVLSEANGKYDVPLLVTLGSPLGLQEVQDVFKDHFKLALEKPKGVGHWLNVADRLDPVCADNTLGGEYGQDIEDVSGFGVNADSPRNPHSGSGYLVHPEVRKAVRRALPLGFDSPVYKSYIGRDLTDQYERSASGARHSVLIQLKSTPKASSVTEVREQVINRIGELVRASGQNPEAVVEPLKRYVAAKLTRQEIETLHNEFRALDIERVWRDTEKAALLYESANTIQIPPAHSAYSAHGHGIRWAVLDTGIRADHPHFSHHQTIESEWDCTKAGSPRSGALDVHGHGTHVAGIIAGALIGVECPDERDPSRVVLRDFIGMAPKAHLHVYKVLDDSGNGQDSWIIKALDHIADVNEQAGELLIAGVNLSLGGNFDPAVYGCGHSPICQELRRLWRQGVLVVLAAGNEGHAALIGADGVENRSMALSVGDPANLEEAIAVGSVEKRRPHTYGVSYFSSRGPTADGRVKPDVVAPGEKIWSASARMADPARHTRDNLYVQMSGTSMAAPHVSGILAAFLSVRTEFIGYPDRVKELLLKRCTDLGRDRYAQGHGLPNLVQMLAMS